MASRLSRAAPTQALCIIQVIIIVAQRQSALRVWCRACGGIPDHDAPTQPVLLFVEDKNLSELLAISIGAFGSRSHRLATVRDHNPTCGLVWPASLLAFVG